MMPPLPVWVPVAALALAVVGAYTRAACTVPHTHGAAAPLLPTTGAV